MAHRWVIRDRADKKSIILDHPGKHGDVRTLQTAIKMCSSLGISEQGKARNHG